MPLRSKYTYPKLTTVLGVLLMTTSAYANPPTSADFVRKASVANLFEIESSNLALEKSKNDDVTEFAEDMVDDHTETGEALKETLSHMKSPIKPAEALDSKHQALLDKLKKASDADFDNQYITMQKNAHDEAINLFSEYAKNGDNTELKKFAHQTLPTLKEHQHHVNSLE